VGRYRRLRGLRGRRGGSGERCGTPHHPMSRRCFFYSFRRSMRHILKKNPFSFSFFAVERGAATPAVLGDPQTPPTNLQETPIENRKTPSTLFFKMFCLGLVVWGRCRGDARSVNRRRLRRALRADADGRARPGLPGPDCRVSG